MLTRQVGSLPLAKNAKHSSSIIGERERANLVVRLARFFHNYVCIVRRAAGAHFTYAHARKLRLRDITLRAPFAIELTSCGGVEERPSGYRDHRRERETRLSRRSAPYMANNVLFCIHVYRLDSVLFFSCILINNQHICRYALCTQEQ